MYMNLRIRSEAAHNMKSMVGTKVESVPKLRAWKLRLRWGAPMKAHTVLKAF
jgi:hypothetical protein